MASQLQLSLSIDNAPARRESSIELCICSEQEQIVELRLTGPASFSKSGTQRKLRLNCSAGETRLDIHSIARPGRVNLFCNGQRLRLRFTPLGLVQNIVHDWVPTLSLSLLIALVMRSFAFASYYVPSPSMVGTLYPGDKFIAEKFSTKVLNRAPQRGEIIIFHHPEKQNETWVKRVIGLPGDLVEIQKGKVWINGDLFEESYVDVAMLNDFGPVSVPPDNFFVLGDNRNNSDDSRYWGYLPRKYIEGSPVFIFWPPRHAGSLRSAIAEVQP